MDTVIDFLVTYFMQIILVLEGVILVAYGATRPCAKHLVKMVRSLWKGIVK